MIDPSIYKKALQREREARKEAEKILEDKAVELYNANQRLQKLNTELEKELEERIESFKQSEIRFSKVISEATDVIYNSTLTGDFTFVNKKATILTEYTEEELLTMNYSELVTSPPLEELREFYQNQVKNDVLTSYVEFQIKSKTGKKYWLGQNVQLVKTKGETTGFLAIARDITERVRANEELRKSEEKYRKLLENMNLGMIEVGKEGRLTKVYESFCELTGYSREELLDENSDINLLAPESYNTVEEHMRLRKEGKATVYEVKMIRKDGKEIWVLISGAPYYDDDGNINGSIAVHLDITARKVAENNLKDAKEMAEASSRAKEIFLANMSHEIRTPLNAVIGLSQLLAKSKLDKSQINYVSTIKSSATTLLGLVNNILDFSKIESGEMHLEKTPFNINELGVNVVKLFNYRANEKNIRIEFNTNLPTNASFNSDQLRLNQVLVNLVNNAIKFTNRGTVKLCINKQDDGEILFEVIDTGIGISEDKIETIFSEFKQENEKIVKQFGGTGLGLSISKSLVELFGGELKVKSVKGEGSTFYFKIHLKACNDEKIEVEELIDESFDWTKVDILLVEDNVVNQFVASKFITDWGAKLTVCDNGERALKKLNERTDFSLILMDIQMPVMNGVECTEEIRKNLKLELPIIALTANAVKGDREKFIAIGMDDYVSKPFDEQQLKKTIIKQIKINSIKGTPMPKDLQDRQIFTTEKLESMSHNNPDFIKKMLQIFMEESEKQIPLMKLSEGEDNVSKLAHKIKPSIDTVADSIMAQDVRKIENKEFIDEPQMIEEFAKDWKELVRQIKIYLSN
ncbi:PAS domain S-box protein [Crocinitomix algicola]|uniref:PAS domain S-box protein n=1 Tax=Crocinitomix algicola TaxID=1740263 RepID=UPI00082F5DC9|nr:PAS domain S-box protein [Crocinitomix algicola]